MRIGNPTTLKSIMIASAICGISAGCGSSDSASTSAALSSVGLSQLPSAASMVSQNSSSSAVIGDRDGVGYSVTGTAPLVSALKANADTYFWNGLVATINGKNVNAITTAERNQFWGGVNGGPGGQGACAMAQSVGESFGRMIESGGSLCYMKNIPKLASFSVTGGDKSTMFDQTAADKLVKIVAKMGPSQTQDVFIKVYGSDSVTSNIYKVGLYFCQSGSVTGVENIEVNKTTGTYSASNYHNESSGKGKMNVTAFLKQNADGTISFDASKDRTASSTFSGTWGKFKADLTITGSNQIFTKMYNTSSSWTNKTYSIANFSGSGISGLRFLEAGFKNYSSDGGSNVNSYSGATEWQNTYYAASTTNALKTQAEAMDLNSDSFFSSISDPSSDVSAYSCTATPDMTADLDFSIPAIATIQTTCDSEKFSDYDMCWNNSVSSAMNKVFQSYNNGL
jgi:hypothetical protein